MFEEEEQEQEVSSLKAALEEAVSAAEAQGRSRQPGEAPALLALALLFSIVCTAMIANVLLRLQVQCVFHIMLERTTALLQDLRTTEGKAWLHHMLACTASLAAAPHLVENRCLQHTA